MKKSILFTLSLLFALAANADNVMTKQADGTYVVRTNTICNARGYRKATPVEPEERRNGALLRTSKAVSAANV